MSAVVSDLDWQGNVYNKMSDNALQLCRICMKSEENLTSIFNTTEKCLKTLAEMLTECINYKIVREDKLPKNICQTCIKQVQDAYALKEKAEESHRRLYELYCKEDDAVDEIKTDSYNAMEKSIQTENFFDFDNLKKFEFKFRENHIEGNRYFCHLCEKTFGELTDLRNHMLKGHTNMMPSIQLPCPVCQRNFSRKDHLKRHLINVHKDDPNKYMSTVRGSKIEQTLECPICMRRLSRKDHLKRHIALIHQRDPNDVLLGLFVEKDMTMTQGPAIFNEAGWHNDQNFLDKLRNEANFMNMPAQFASFPIKQEPVDIYNALTKNDLNDGSEIDKPSDLLSTLAGEENSLKRKCNQWIDETPEERTCQLCQRVFSHLSHLRCHMESAHTAQKPYTCKYCLKSFAQKHDLDSHERRHTGERYKCEQCDASFLQLYGLRQHALSAHGRDLELSNESNLKKVDMSNSSKVTFITGDTFDQANGSNDNHFFENKLFQINETENSFSHHTMLPV